MSVQYMDSPVGKLRLTAENGRLTEICFRGDDCPGADDRDPVLDRARQWLEGYFAGQRPDPEAIPIAPAGTEFQMAVWTLLRQIPYGQTLTYGALAGQLGKNSPQAVGQAVGKNPLPILIPCHRVLGAGGRLVGFSGGLEIKKALLRLEGAPFREEKKHGTG